MNETEKLADVRESFARIDAELARANQGSVRIPAFWAKIIGGILVALLASFATLLWQWNRDGQRQDDAIASIEREVARISVEQKANTEWRIRSQKIWQQYAADRTSLLEGQRQIMAEIIKHEHGVNKKP